MSVWLTIPSSRPAQEANPVLLKWRAQGYRIALWCDSSTDAEAKLADFWRVGDYPGYAVAVNQLVLAITELDQQAEWFVIGGDDTYPDPHKRADEIARQCCEHFGYQAAYKAKCNVITPETVTDTYSRMGALQHAYVYGSTFGVMQPTGDRYANGQIDRICGSAWIGREFARRVNQGRGPLWPEYTHMFVDEELQEVAKKYGVLWQRPDLTQLHIQYCRESAAIDSGAVEGRHPEHISHDGYTPEHWVKYQRLFLERRMAGFPGSELA